MSDRRWTIAGVGIGVVCLGIGLIVFQGKPYQMSGWACVLLGLLVVGWAIFGPHGRNPEEVKSTVSESGNSKNTNTVTGNIVNINVPSQSPPAAHDPSGDGIQGQPSPPADGARYTTL